MLFLNAGSRYVIGDLGKVHEKILTNEITKKVILFSMFFVATRDIIISLVLCMLYVVLIDGIFHEKRRFAMIQPGTENPVTETDYQKARDTVIQYEKQKAYEMNKDKNNDLYHTYLNNLSSLYIK